MRTLIPWKWLLLSLHSLTLRLHVDNTNSKLQTRIAFQGPAAFASYSF